LNFGAVAEGSALPKDAKGETDAKGES